MEKVIIRLLKSWKNGADEYEAGTILKLDKELANSLIEAKVAESYDPASDAANADLQDQIRDAVKAAVEEIKNELKPDNKTENPNKSIIEVHDKSDDDPTWGYLPGNSKAQDELSEDEVFFAFGRFAREAARAASGAGESENLMKCRQRSEKLVEKAAGDGLVVGEDEFGGYLVFPAAAALINRTSLENAIVRPRATRLNLSTQSLGVPYLKDDDHSSDQIFGGIKVYFNAELKQSTSSRPKFGKLNFTLHKMTAMGYVSEEWAKWSPVSTGSWLIPQFGQAIGWKEDLVFITGNGAGMPKGLLNCGAKITVAKESGQSAATFVLNNSTKMFARLLVRNDASVVWIMNRTVFPQLPLFNVAVGTGGSAVFVNNAQGKPGQTLWGYPIVYSEKAEALGTTGDVILTDLSDYIVADDQAGPAIARSIHLKFDYGQEAFRIVKWIDGQNYRQTAFTPKNGDTLSPVVVVATRS